MSMLPSRMTGGRISRLKVSANSPNIRWLNTFTCLRTRILQQPTPMSLSQNSLIKRFFSETGALFVAGLDMEPSLLYEAGVRTTTYRETAPCPYVRPYQMLGSGSKGNFSRPAPRKPPRDEPQPSSSRSRGG